MDSGSIFPNPIDLNSEYSLSSNQDCAEQFVGDAQSSPYTTGKSLEHIQRDDTLSSLPTIPFDFRQATHGRFMQSSGEASGVSSFGRGASRAVDSKPASTSTSPTSVSPNPRLWNNSDSTYGQTHYTTNPLHLSSVAQSQQAFVPQNIYAGQCGSCIPHSSSQSTFSFPAVKPLPSTHDPAEPGSYGYSPSYLRYPYSPYGIGSYSETPRTIIQPVGVPFSPVSAGYYPMARQISQSYNGNPHDSANFPWPNLEITGEIRCDARDITPEIHAKIEKGMFLAPEDNKWTCYRRNYFTVQCSFDLHDVTRNAVIHLVKGDRSMEQIKAFGMKLCASVDAPAGKTIELVQHTPKRDNGPKTKVEIVKVSPTSILHRTEHSMAPHNVYHLPSAPFHATGIVPGPYLPLQTTTDPAPATDAQPSSASAYSNAGPSLQAPGQSTTHTFERVQFKQATANNGKRRASQQYFHLIIELFADVRKDGALSPSWVKIGHRVSDKIVVRGRSPSHYQNTAGNNGQTGRGGAGTAGGTGYGGTSGATFGNLSATGGRTSQGGQAGYGTSARGQSGVRNRQVYQDQSPTVASDQSSIEDLVDQPHHLAGGMTGIGLPCIQDSDEYGYHPGPMYEQVLRQDPILNTRQLPLPKIESIVGLTAGSSRYQPAYKAEYPGAKPGSQYDFGSGRFQSYPTSEGLFPTSTFPPLRVPESDYI